MEPIINIDPLEETNIILRNIYYKPYGLYQTLNKFLEAIKQEGHEFDPEIVKKFLHKQAIWQVHSPKPKYIPRVSFNRITIPNYAHQADLLYMPHDMIGKFVYKYCLCICDVASRYKAAYPITERSAYNVAIAFKNVYKSSDIALCWPKVLQVDNGSEFKGEVIDLMKRKKIRIKIGNTHRSQCIVERFNRTLATKLFRIQDAAELLFPTIGRYRKWVKNLQSVIKAHNNTYSRLINMSPANAIRLGEVFARPAQPASRPVGFLESRLLSMCPVRYLLEPGELEGGRRRATDMNWSPEIYYVKYSQVCKNQPVMYRLKKIPYRFFVREELLVIPSDTELPSASILNNLAPF